MMQKISVRLVSRLALAATTVFVSACNGGSSSRPLPIQALAPAGAPVKAKLYAYLSMKPALAEYPAQANGQTSPLALIHGDKTHLHQGHGGIALAGDGTIYVLDGRHAHLLTFAANSDGNAAPAGNEALSRGVFGGIVLDGKGNFWTADTTNGKLVRFVLSGAGSAKPNDSIAPRLDTESGLMPAYATTVAMDAAGHLYCVCVLLYRGAERIGVSEYTLDHAGNAKIIRSFYDYALPEDPPQEMHIDASGTMYLASPLYRTGIFVYGKDTPTGGVHFERLLAGPATTLDSIAAITTDASGELYAATPTGVSVFSPQANGNVPPIRRITDTSRLHWNLNQYGDFLVIH